jgi:hypothetical protein
VRGSPRPSSVEGHVGEAPNSRSTSPWGKLARAGSSPARSLREGVVGRVIATRLSPLVSCALLLLLPVAARAGDGPRGPRFEAAVRLGLAWPFYTDALYEPTLNLTAYPLWLDVGVRLSPVVFLGAYFSFAPTSATGHYTGAVSPCDIHCYAREYQFGLELQVHPFVPPPGMVWVPDPWVGVGAGYEVRQWRYDGGGPCTDEPFQLYCDVPHVGAIRGPEFLLQIGFSLRRDAFSLGPYFSATYGVYTEDAGTSISEPHWWLSVGLRFTVTL